MNVTYFSLNFPELSQTFVYNEMRGLKEKGAKIRVVAQKRASGDVSDLPQRYGIDDIAYIQPPRASRLGRARLAARELVHLAMRGRILDAARLVPARRHMPISAMLATANRLNSEPGIIHCHFGTAGLTIAHLKALGLVDAPLTTVFHGFDITQFLKGKPAGLYDELFEQADLLLPISDLWHRKLLDLGAPADKVRTLRLGIDLSAFQYKPRIVEAGTPVRFLSVGRMTEKKGHGDTIAAFAALAARRPDLDLRLDIVGNGPLLADMQARAARTGLGQRLTLHGGLPHARVRELLDAAHVFVLPSVTAADGDMEGIPVSIMEAMAMGLAVISTRHSGIPELVEHEGSGLLVEERDVDALGAAMEELAVHHSRIEALGARGRAIVERDYDEKVQADKLMALLQSIHPADGLSSSKTVI